MSEFKTISPKPSEIWVQIFRIFQSYYVLSNDIGMNVKILHIKKCTFQIRPIPVLYSCLSPEHHPFHDREALFQVSWNLLISRDKASSTMRESSGLSTEPWCTPNLTSNSSLRPSQTQTQLRTFSYIPSSFTIHSSTLSFLIADQIIF